MARIITIQALRIYIFRLKVCFFSFTTFFTVHNNIIITQTDAFGFELVLNLSSGRSMVPEFEYLYFFAFGGQGFLAVRTNYAKSLDIVPIMN